jgi:hypothetical protein
VRVCGLGVGVRRRFEVGLGLGRWVGSGVGCVLMDKVRGGSGGEKAR